MWIGFIIGGMFGFILHRAGVVRYSRILGTLLLKDFKAMKFMFTGLAIAAIIYGLSNLLNLGVVPRINGYFGIGHIVGGILFGIGMSLGGLCPGTCIARFGAGKILAGAGLLGIMAGVFVYDALFPVLGTLGGEPQFITWAMLLNIPYGYLALALGVLFLLMSFFIDQKDPAKKFDQFEEKKSWLRREWGWLFSGIIAGLLIVAATASGEYLSFAGSFQALGAHLASIFGFSLQSVPSLSASTAWRAMFVVGALLGAFFSSSLAQTIKQEKITPLFESAFGHRMYLRVGLVFLSGFLLITGALIGGGCTTGAFMSAWPTLSVGSFVMAMTFFAAAMATAQLLYVKRTYLVHQVKEKAKLALIND